jgi:hypothetical protein
VLLIAGLVVGAGGCYFAVSNSFEQKATDYEATISAMEQEITTHEGRVADLEAEITGYESQVADLDAEIAGYESQIADLEVEKSIHEQQIKDYEATQAASVQILSLYESQIASLKTEKLDLEQVIRDHEVNALKMEHMITDYETEIERLQALLYSEEVNIFAAYGFGFRYPEGWIISVSGMFESVATENSGAVTLTSPDGEAVYTVGWIYTIQVQDLRGTLDSGLDSMIVEFPDIELGERVETNIAEHMLLYQLGTMPDHELAFYAWYCDVSDYLFIGAQVKPKPADMFDSLYDFLETFVCH